LKVWCSHLQKKKNLPAPNAEQNNRRKLCPCLPVESPVVLHAPHHRARPVALQVPVIKAFLPILKINPSFFLLYCEKDHNTL